MTNFFYYTKKNILGKNKKIYKKKNSKKKYIKQNNKMINIKTYIKKTKSKKKIKGGEGLDIDVWKENFDNCCRNHSEIDEVSTCMYANSQLRIPHSLHHTCHVKNKHSEESNIRKNAEKKFQNYLQTRKQETATAYALKYKIERLTPTFEKFEALTVLISEIIKGYVKKPHDKLSLMRTLTIRIQELYTIIRNFIIDYDNKITMSLTSDNNYLSECGKIIALMTHFFNIYNKTLYNKLYKITENTIAKEFNSNDSKHNKEDYELIQNIVSYSQESAHMLDNMKVKFENHAHLTKKMQTKSENKIPDEWDILRLYNIKTIIPSPRRNTRQTIIQSSRPSARQTIIQSSRPSARQTIIQSSRPSARQTIIPSPKPSTIPSPKPSAIPSPQQSPRQLSRQTIRQTIKQRRPTPRPTPKGIFRKIGKIYNNLFAKRKS
jgi:hypothetical protein